MPLRTCVTQFCRRNDRFNLVKKCSLIVELLLSGSKTKILCDPYHLIPFVIVDKHLKSSSSQRRRKANSTANLERGNGQPQPQPRTKTVQRLSHRRKAHISANIEHENGQQWQVGQQQMSSGQHALLRRKTMAIRRPTKTV